MAGMRAESANIVYKRLRDLKGGADVFNWDMKSF